MNIVNLPVAVTLLAVTKTFPAKTIIEAYSAGFRHFGENYVEEFASKYQQLPAEVKENAIFHMIGHVQSHKARQVVQLFGWIDSIDSVKLATRLSRFASEIGKNLKILLEINLTGEASKSGFDLFGWKKNHYKLNAFLEIIKVIQSLPRLQLAGLMVMPPRVIDPDKNRWVFASTKQLFDLVRTHFNQYNFGSDFSDSWKHLSMGTSQDYQVALEEGATMVRLGTAIFGQRPIAFVD